MTVEVFQRLEKLVAAQSENTSDAASVITSFGTPTASIALLTSSSISGHTIANASSPADPETLFQACSISKPVFGLAILRTVDQGKLALTDPITKHLPRKHLEAITTPSTTHLLDHVTIQQLASHTAGVTIGGFSGYDPAGYIPDLVGILSGAAGTNTPQIRLNRLPGLKWRYAGGGTTINQAVLESIHGKPLPEIMRELVFEPLGMTRSFYTLPLGEKNYAQCWDTGVTETKPLRWHVLPELAAAGLWTTPTDLLKALRGIRDSAEGRSDFLSKETALIGLTALEGANGFTSGGWVNAKGWFGHGGSSNPGWRCRLMGVWDRDDLGGKFGKAKGEGLAIMTNSSMGDETAVKLMWAIAYLREWPGRNILALHEHVERVIPFADSSVAVNDAWKEWKGKWEVDVEDGNKNVKKGHVLEIDQDSQDRPTVALADMPALRLRKAAIPAVRSKEDGKEGVDLVVGGLDMMLSLGYDEEGKHSLEIWPGNYEEVLTCRRLRH